MFCLHRHVSLNQYNCFKAKIVIYISETWKQYLNRIYFQSETTLETVLCFPFKMACKVADDKLTRSHFLKTLITRPNLHARVIHNVLLVYSIIHAGLPLFTKDFILFRFIKVRF